MKKVLISATLIALVTSSLFLSNCGPATPEVEKSNLPQNVLQSCTVSSTEFNSWFANGTASENGLVSPANSVTFPSNDNCDFYKWSQQMFLWITSPTTSGQYTSGNTVLESPVFYTISPAENGKRVFIKHEANTPIRVSKHVNQTGPNRLPIIVDKNGKRFEVEHAEAGQKHMLKNAAGKLVELHTVEMDAAGKPLFKDATGKIITQAKPVLKSSINTSQVVKEIKVGTNSLFLDANGNVVETESAQATQDGLIATNGSLVYYISMANDVYAYFCSGVYNNALNGAQFPTDSIQRDSILAYAQKMGWPAPPDPNALAIELKTSWVETKGLSNLGSYITMDAIIPVYDTTNPNKWIPKGERKAQLALIGMHIVGSVAGHPEMVWATFEHRNNTPNASYSYLDSSGNVQTQPADTGGGWLLCTNAAGTPINVSHISAGTTALGDTLAGKNNFMISQSNTLRTKPWGVTEGSVPNQENPSAAASNSQIIAINNAIYNMLPGNDIRKNYFLIGATWTFGGAAPNGSAYTSTDTTPGVAIGTSQLANSTMETYFQFGPTYTSYGSCFGCHNSKSSLAPAALSHVFSDLMPLAPNQQK